MEEQSLSHQLIELLAGNVVQLVIFGLSMAVFQFVMPAHKAQKNWDKSAAIDLSYSFLLTLCTPLFLLLPIATVEWVYLQYPQAILWREPVATLSIVGQFVVAVFVIDFVSYWRHRLMHSRLLWPIHAIHHSSGRLNWLSTERFHPLNTAVSTFFEVLVGQLFFSAEVVLYASLSRRFYNFFIHSNIKLDYGPFSYLFVSPCFHHWHHSKAAQAIDKNYSTFFSLNDWLFGSFYLPKDRRFPEDYGEAFGVREHLVAHFFHPFRVWLGRAG